MSLKLIWNQLSESHKEKSLYLNAKSDQIYWANQKKKKNSNYQFIRRDYRKTVFSAVSTCCCMPPSGESILCRANATKMTSNVVSDQKEKSKEQCCRMRKHVKRFARQKVVAKQACSKFESKRLGRWSLVRRETCESEEWVRIGRKRTRPSGVTEFTLLCSERGEGEPVNGLWRSPKMNKMVIVIEDEREQMQPKQFAIGFAITIFGTTSSVRKVCKWIGVDWAIACVANRQSNEEGRRNGNEVWSIEGAKRSELGRDNVRFSLIVANFARFRPDTSGFSGKGNCCGKQCTFEMKRFWTGALPRRTDHSRKGWQRQSVQITVKQLR